MPGRDARHVAEPARREAQEGGVGLCEEGRLVHHRPGDEVRHVAHHRDQPVVVLRGQGERGRAEVADHGDQGGVTLGRGLRGGGEHPGGADEQVGARAAQARLLRPRHRVPAHVAGILDGRDERGLDAGHVRDDQLGTPRCERRAQHLDDVRGRHGDHGDRRLAVGLGRLDDARRERVARGPLVEVLAGDAPARVAQAEGHGAADEPEAHDVGPRARSVGEVIASWLVPWR